MIIEENVTSKVLLLFSGGIDSTACIQYYLDLGYSVNPIFIKYGQLSESQELRSANQICEYYNLTLLELNIETKSKLIRGEILGRNLMLLANALFNINDNEAIVLGVHTGTGYYDCSSDFAEYLNKIIHESTNGLVRLETPFIEWDKGQIWSYCKQKNIPLELTYSCENGHNQRCGECATCKDLNKLYE
jgi:7-cyano-7-deazaguanine synthase